MTVSRLGAVMLVAVAAAGCNTVAQQRRTHQVSAREDELLARERLKRLSADVEALEAELQQLSTEMADIRRSRRDFQRGELATVQERLAALEKEIAAVDARRRSDRDKIVESLSARITALVSEAGSRPAAGGYGYEHIVQPGETLSHIAQAYGVTVRAIVEANNISNPDTVRAGTELFIPE